MNGVGEGRELARFAVAAGTPQAAEAAAEVFRAGGNAADAAVAAAAAVAVTEPLMSSLGGGGFALVRRPDGTAEVVDYYDQMPGKGLPPSTFGGKPQTVALKYGAGIRSIVGAASCAVPGSLRGWEKLLERHGRLTMRETLAPAARLAREGFPLCMTSAEWFAVAEEVLNLTPETRKNFLRGGHPLREGEEASFPELAETLEALREGGASLFYEGELAREISNHILREGGLITEEDLGTYEAVVREPLRFSYRGRTVHTNGPPSAGGATLAQILRVLSAYDLPEMGGEDYAEVLAGAMRLALDDRRTAYTDIAQNRAVAERLTSEAYAAEQRLKLRQPGTERGGVAGSLRGNTTHLSCVDADGLAVSITASMGYGSGVVVPGTGIPMNNTLGEPELNPRGFHSARPGDRLISSMSPTVLAGAGGAVISLGSPGASRIPTALAQALVNAIDFGMPLREAVLAPRIHAETMPEGDVFAYEVGARGVDGSTTPPAGALRYEAASMFFGGVNAAGRDPDGLFEAAADPRRSGGVAYA
jgi:gamma-glutamyltranspeptidase/glutathione hydrolase